METQLRDAGEALATIVSRPMDPAPPRFASYEERAEWSERYVAWYLAHAPLSGSLPPDVDASYRYQVEFTSCVLDPQLYERQTQQELTPVTVH